jgi:hypothetical protein
MRTISLEEKEILSIAKSHAIDKVITESEIIDYTRDVLRRAQLKDRQLVHPGSTFEFDSANTGSLEVGSPTRNLVDSIYREILGRPADSWGLETYGRMLFDTGIEAGLVTLVRHLLKSTEYANQVTHRSNEALNQLGANGKKLVNGKKVAHIVSLGTHCLTSFYLKKYGMKRYSLPFDWIFASPQTVLHCIDDNFKTFLDPSHYTSLIGKRQSDEPGANHEFYLREHGVGHMFTHRDPLNAEDHRYFVDAVTRFEALKKNSDGKLFLMIARHEHDVAKSFSQLSDRINSLTSNSALICIQLKAPTKQPGCHNLRVVNKIEEHTLYEFQPSSSELGIGFDELIDDMIVLRLVRDFDIQLADSIA